MNSWIAILYLVVLAFGSFMIYFSLQYTCTTEFTEHGHPIEVCIDYNKIEREGYKHR